VTGRWTDGQTADGDNASAAAFSSPEELKYNYYVHFPLAFPINARLLMHGPFEGISSERVRGQVIRIQPDHFFSP
jgi:hypothetical protein